MYRLDEDEEGYYLESYDEMHNHMLIADSGFMPFPKNYVVRPTFPTPNGSWEMLWTVLYKAKTLS